MARCKVTIARNLNSTISTYTSDPTEENFKKYQQTLKEVRDSNVATIYFEANVDKVKNRTTWMDHQKDLNKTSQADTKKNPVQDIDPEKQARQLKSIQDKVEKYSKKQK